MATKVKTPVIEEAVAEKEERNQFLEMARKVLLAGVGAVALAQDEAEDFVKKLVERGEIAEKDGKKLVREIMDRRKKDVEQTAEKAEDGASKRIEEVLARMSIPTKADINALTEKVNTLAKKVDDLKKEKVA
jgi:poly(hydroxyalkanoate) granule-associated protein